MKRMNEVFELPVDEMDICEAVDHYSEEKDAAIVRAINHVDALADALTDLLDALVNRGSRDSINNQIIAAARAINNYRGEK